MNKETEGNDNILSVPPQIQRLFIIAASGVLLFFTARHFLVPDSFGEYGWYRGDALKEISSRPISFAGRNACLECHEEIVKITAKFQHQTLSCESCHWASSAHTEDPNISPRKIENPLFCLQCHNESPSRPEKFPQVNTKDHYPGETCMTCHSPHQPTEAPTK